MQILSRNIPAVSAALQDAVYRLSALSELSLLVDFTLESRFIRHLSTCPSLRCLCLYLHPGASIAIDPDSEANSVHFPALRKVDFCVEAWATINSLFSLISPSTCAITDVHVSLQVSSVSEFQKLSQALGRLPSIETLELEISWGSYSLLCISPSAFSPLFALHALRIFHVAEGRCQLSLDDATVSEMAHAWPHIEQLSLLAQCYDVDSHQTSVTIPGLLPFALHCPRLNELRILLAAVTANSLHFTDPESAQKWAEMANHPPHGLAVLELGDPPLEVGCTVEVAGYLSAMFPHLESIDDNRRSEYARNTSLALVGELEGGWDGVMALFDIFAKVRRQERTGRSKV